MKRHITYFEARRPLIASSTLSSTESFGNRLVTWNVRAMPSAVRRWLGQRVTSWPNSSTRPDEAGRMPLMRLNKVVLPAPFGPMIALRSPGMIFSDTPRTARKPPNAFDSSRNSSTGWPPLAGFIARPVPAFPPPASGRGFGGEFSFAVRTGREVAAINRLLQELILPIGPELADIRIGLDHGVPQLRLVIAEKRHLLDLADVDILDRVAHIVERHRSARRFYL